MMNKYFLSTFISLILLFLLLRLFFFYTSRPTYKDGQEVQLTTRITSDPKIQGRNQRFSIRLSLGAYVSVTTVKFPSYSAGQLVTIKGKILVAESNKKQFYTMRYPEIALQKEQNLFLAPLYSLRQSAMNRLDRRLSQEHAGLLLGIVLGVKKNMSDDFMDALRTAGVMHVIAASGMNVSMVAGAIFYLLQGKVFGRKTAIVLSLLGVWLYAVLAGFEASIVRATVMASIAFLASILGRQKMAVYILFLTGSLMLLVSPRLLIDVGFQLSFLATAGIMFIQPILQHVSVGRWKSLLSTDILTTISAQVATLPILLGNFGEVNILSVVVNGLVLWTVPFVMILGGVGIVIGFLFEPLSLPFIYACLPFLWFFEAVVRLFATVPLQVSIKELPVAISLGYYVLLIAFITFALQYRQKVKYNRVSVEENA